MKTILSYGLGVDSTSILLNWLENPESRVSKVYRLVEGGNDPQFEYEGEVPIDLSELVVLTAMTGDEFPELKDLVEQHILPRLREHGVRYVQVARKSKSEKLIVLDDSTNPTRLYLEGAYKLSQELYESAGVPQFASGRRRCSIKSKGWPLDTWIKQEVGDTQFIQAIGYATEEEKRVTKDQSYSAIRWPEGQKIPIYPLIQDWQWDRERCIDYIRSVTGAEWPKSACVYCPFAAQESVLPRYAKNPEAAAFSLFIEYVSMCLNHRQTLYSHGSLMSIVQREGDRRALKLFQKKLDRHEWGIYHVRRIYYRKGIAPRSVRLLETGKRKRIEKRLLEYGVPEVWDDGIPRVWAQQLEPDVFPALQELYVAAPHTMEDKEIKSFQRKWEMAVAGDWSFIPQRPTAEEEAEAEVGDLDEGAQEQSWQIGSLACPTERGRPYMNEYLPNELVEHDLKLEQRAWEEEMGDILALPYEWFPDC